MRRKRGLLLLSVLLISLTGCMTVKEIEKENQKQIEKEKNSSEETAISKPRLEYEISTEVKHHKKMDKREIMDLNSFFDHTSCGVFYDKSDDLYQVYQPKLAKKRQSPCSSFKIISTLLGLKYGVVSSKDSKMSYNGTEYWNTEWNQDLTLRGAFQTSCIWYFKQILEQVGSEKIRGELESLHYGNEDISQWEGCGINSFPELNGFWLDSSLKISPMEQVEILINIFEGEGYKEQLSVLKEVMKVKQQGNWTIYGKTGTSSEGYGWFCGMSEKEKQRIYFAVFLQNGSGKDAKDMIISIFQQNQ